MVSPEGQPEIQKQRPDTRSRGKANNRILDQKIDAILQAPSAYRFCTTVTLDPAAWARFIAGSKMRFGRRQTTSKTARRQCGTSVDRSQAGALAVNCVAIFSASRTRRSPVAHVAAAAPLQRPRSLGQRSRCFSNQRDCSSPTVCAADRQAFRSLDLSTLQTLASLPPRYGHLLQCQPVGPSGVRGRFSMRNSS